MNASNRYLVFTLNEWIPHARGGWDDFVGAFATIEDALRSLINNNHNAGFQIVDTESMKVIVESRDCSFSAWFVELYLYTKENISGGSLHIALDDGNLDDGYIEFCIQYAKKNSDYMGQELANHLLLVSNSTRERVQAIYNQFVECHLTTQQIGFTLFASSPSNFDEG